MSGTVKTSKGLHEGFSVNEVIAAYGTSEMKFAYENMELYECNITDANRQPGIIRFVVRQSDVLVEYISLRKTD